ncbi:MAG TPA: GNAT family N-acetyltransferase [Terracidiphilus sp.]|nr:GNAT family N-acetyltransferase [Terracidiphilus sp.]
MEIRGMVEEDAEAVVELTSQLGYRRNGERIREWIGETAARPEERAAFVACLGDAVAGWIEISVERRLQSEPFAMIGGLVVRDGERGRGIGRQLCQRAEDWAWERGLRTVRVTSRSTREDAHRFYLRDSYELVKTSLVFEKRRPD